jgi:hypothetical protein
MKKRRILKITDVRLTPDGTDVHTAPLKYFDVVDIEGKVTVRSPTDWSAVARHINPCRVRAHQRAVEQHRREAEEWLALSKEDQDRRRPFDWKWVTPPNRPVPEPWPRFTRPAVSSLHASTPSTQGSGIFGCRICGEWGYQPFRYGRKPHYCSPACRPQPESRAKPRATIRCVQCGEFFSPKRADARTCSGKCRVALHRAA